LLFVANEMSQHRGLEELQLRNELWKVHFFKTLETKCWSFSVYSCTFMAES